MPISLQSTKAANNVVVGQAAYFSETEEILLNSGGMVFLKSGCCSIGDSALYPNAYGKFDNFITPVMSPFPNISMNVTYLSTLGLSFVRFANGLWIASQQPASGNSGGLIATSPDGINWTIVSRTRYSFQNITYFGGKYVAGAYDRGLSTPTYGLYTSTDLIAWSLVSSRYNTSNFNMYDSVIGNGLLVTVGYSGTIVTYNGTTATTRNPGTGSQHLFSVDYGNGKFVAPASTGMNYSTDGATWTQVTPTGWASAGTTCVVFGNGMFIVSTTSSGLWWKSADGINWTSFAMPTSSVGSYCSRYGFVFSTTSGFVTSTDGITWETITAGVPAYVPIASMCNNGTDILAAGATVNTLMLTVPSVGLLKETSTGYGKLYMRIK